MLDGPDTGDVQPPTAVAAQARGAVLVDVRETDEWEAGHAPGAVHVPLGTVERAVGRFAGQTVLTVCRSGGRSTRAVEVFAASGVTVRNVAGGMAAWAEAGLPVVRADGSTGAVA